MALPKKAKDARKDPGRPTGTKNPTALDRVRRDETAIIDACRKGALAGDAACAEFCLTLVGRYPPPLICGSDDKALLK